MTLKRTGVEYFQVLSGIWRSKKGKPRKKIILTSKSQIRSRITKNLSATLIILVDLLPRKRQDVMCCKLREISGFHDADVENSGLVASPSVQRVIYRTPDVLKECGTFNCKSWYVLGKLFWSLITSYRAKKKRNFARSPCWIFPEQGLFIHTPSWHFLYTVTQRALNDIGPAQRTQAVHSRRK
jgi:hypothetical protein